MASVKQAWIRDYGPEKGLEMWNEHVRTKLTDFSPEAFIRRHGAYLGPIKYTEYKQKCKTKGTLFGYQQRYGEVDGKKKWLENAIHPFFKKAIREVREEDRIKKEALLKRGITTIVV